MKIDLCGEFHVHLHHPGSEVPSWAIEVLRKLDLILNTQETIMSLETDALDTLEANTKAIDGAEESAEAAFLRLAEMIANLKTTSTDPATATRIMAVAEALKARASRLGAAVEATPQV